MTIELIKPDAFLDWLNAEKSNPLLEELESICLDILGIEPSVRADLKAKIRIDHSNNAKTTAEASQSAAV